MLSVLGKLDWFFKQHWKRNTIAILLLMLGGVLEVIPPKLVGIAVDEIQLGTLTGDRLVHLLQLFFLNDRHFPGRMAIVCRDTIVLGGKVLNHIRRESEYFIGIAQTVLKYKEPFLRLARRAFVFS
jgi:ABC-type multidrug transport system fused ATPase/permease subunit